MLTNDECCHQIVVIVIGNDEEQSLNCKKN